MDPVGGVGRLAHPCQGRTTGWGWRCLLLHDYMELPGCGEFRNIWALFGKLTPSTRIQTPGPDNPLNTNIFGLVFFIGATKQGFAMPRGNCEAHGEVRLVHYLLSRFREVSLEGPFPRQLSDSLRYLGTPPQLSCRLCAVLAEGSWGRAGGWLLRPP